MVDLEVLEVSALLGKVVSHALGEVDAVYPFLTQSQVQGHVKIGELAELLKEVQQELLDLLSVNVLLG